LEIGIWIFFGCTVIALSLLAFVETKSQKRFWDWRERLIESINHNTESIDEVVKALMYEK